MGAEVNEVINNICTKLGYAASEITPEMARYMIAKDSFACIASALISIISVIILVKAIKRGKTRSEEERDLPALEICLSVVFGMILLISTCVLLDRGADLIGWVASPKASMVQYVLVAIS